VFLTRDEQDVREYGGKGLIHSGGQVADLGIGKPVRDYVSFNCLAAEGVMTFLPGLLGKVYADIGRIIYCPPVGESMPDSMNARSSP
jgi:hypothetical protein